MPVVELPDLSRRAPVHPGKVFELVVLAVSDVPAVGSSLQPFISDAFSSEAVDALRT
jgi:hypothetical protein